MKKRIPPDIDGVEVHVSVSEKGAKQRQLDDTILLAEDGSDCSDFV